MVFVDHGGGWTTGYAHLDTWTIDNPIEPGERIGTVGGSGSAGGTPTPHYAARLSNISQPVVFAGVTIPVGWNNYSPSAPKTTSTNCGAPPVQVLPVAQPTFLDPWGARNDRYVVPLSTGAQYLSGASVKPARTYWGRGTVTLMANTLPGFQLTGTTTWSHTFSTAPC